VTNSKTILAALALAVFTAVAASKVVAASSDTPATTTATVTFTAAQVAAGQKQFTQSCVMCHGANLQGISGPALTGSDFAAAMSTVGTTLTYISENMPLTAPGSLSHDQYTSVLAFLLSKNGFKAGGDPLTFDAALKSDVKIVK
jgi:polar amino acid transport system substrate-binding protein